MRKGALNNKAVELGCNKIALGHHKEDIVETMMMSLFFEGRFYSFSPVTYLDRMQLYAIRPLMYVSEKDVIGFKNKYDLPVVKSPCPADGNTKREYMKKNLLANLEKKKILAYLDVYTMPLRDLEYKVGVLIIVNELWYYEIT